MFNRNYIVGAASLILAVCTFIFEQAAAAYIGKFAEKFLNPDLLSGGISMTVSPSDIVIIFLLAIAILAIFWPIVSKFFSTELTRKKVIIDETKKVIVSNYTFTSKRELDSLGDDSYSFVFVDCNFHLNRLVLYGYQALETYVFRANHGLVASDDQLQNIFLNKKRNMAFLSNPVLLNCRITVKEIIVNEEAIKFWIQNPNRIEKYIDE